MLVYVDGLDNGRSCPVSFVERFPIPQEYNLTGNVLEGKVEGVISKSDDLYKFKGRLRANADFVCAKCLAPVNYPFDIELEESFSDKDTGLSDGEIWTFKGGTIDLTPAVLSNIYLETPYRVLCDEGCKGLCPVCGCNLNEKECGCDRSQPDSRFDILKSLFTQ